MPVAMGDAGVGSLLLADTATSVQRFVSVFVGVYVLLIFAYIIASWVPGGGRRRSSASGSSSTTSASRTCGSSGA